MFLQDRRPKGPTPIASSVEVVSARLGLARPDSLAVLERHWTQLLGSGLADHCHLRGLRDSVLVIDVDDPAISDHLHMMRADLINASNEICGGTFVTEIRLTVARTRRVSNRNQRLPE